MCIRKRCRGVTCSPRSITKKHVERLYNLVSISAFASFSSIFIAKILSLTGSGPTSARCDPEPVRRRPRRLQRYRVPEQDTLQQTQPPYMWITSEDKSQGVAGSPFLVASERINKRDADVMNVSVFSRSSSYVSSRPRYGSAFFPLWLMRVIQDSGYPGSSDLYGIVRDLPLHLSAG